MKATVIARQQHDDVYLLDIGDGCGVIVDAERTVSPVRSLDSVLARGYWVACASAPPDVVAAKAWDESLHPREPAGTEAGGEFAGAGGTIEPSDADIERAGDDLSDAMRDWHNAATPANYETLVGLALDGSPAYEAARQETLDALPWVDGRVTLYRGGAVDVNTVQSWSTDRRWAERHAAYGFGAAPGARSAIGGVHEERFARDALLIALPHEGEVLVDVARRRAKAWDEAQHPREPSGSDAGGEFAPAGGGRAPRRAPDRLAESARDLITVALPNADVSLGRYARHPNVVGLVRGALDALDAVDHGLGDDVERVELVLPERRQLARASWVSADRLLRVNPTQAPFEPDDDAAWDPKLPQSWREKREGMSRSLRDTGIHEAGHVLQDRLRRLQGQPVGPNMPGPRDWKDAPPGSMDYVAAWLEPWARGEPKPHAPPGHGVSFYATKNAHESFAETFLALATGRELEHPAVGAMKYLLTKYGYLPGRRL